MNGCSINIEDALRAYLGRNMLERPAFEAVLFDMDGVLYDSMPRHAKAWKSVCDEAGIEAVTEEFLLMKDARGPRQSICWCAGSLVDGHGRRGSQAV